MDIELDKRKFIKIQFGAGICYLLRVVGKASFVEDGFLDRD